MLKKLFVTAAAAAAMSVPLAGAAWADKPDDPGSNGNGIGQGGIPQKAGTVLGSLGENPPPDGTSDAPVPPGSVYKVAAKTDCVATGTKCSTPDAYGEALDAFADRNADELEAAGIEVPDTFGPTPPGMATKAFTSGCANGHSTGICIPNPTP